MPVHLADIHNKGEKREKDAENWDFNYNMKRTRILCTLWGLATLESSH